MTGSFAQRMGPLPASLAGLFRFNLILLLLLLGMFTLIVRVLDRRPLGSAGLAFCGRWRAELGIGLGIGAGTVLLVGCGERLLGIASFSLNFAAWRGMLGSGAILAVALGVAATNEEMIFRGYPFQCLAEAIGTAGAVVVFSLLFGVAHLANPFHSGISTVNTVLVGVLLAIAYLRTRALWLPIGIHFAWNYAEGYLLGLPVSGLDLPHPILKARVGGPLWLAGGAYGPEASVLVSAALLLAVAYVAVSKRIYTSPEMRQVLAQTLDRSEQPISLMEDFNRKR